MRPRPRDSNGKHGVGWSPLSGPSMDDPMTPDEEDTWGRGRPAPALHERDPGPTRVTGGSAGARDLRGVAPPRWCPGRPFSALRLSGCWRRRAVAFPGVRRSSSRRWLLVGMVGVVAVVLMTSFLLLLAVVMGGYDGDWSEPRGGASRLTPQEDSLGRSMFWNDDAPRVPLSVTVMRELLGIVDEGRLWVNPNSAASAAVRRQVQHLRELHGLLEVVDMADGTRGVEKFLRLARFLQAVKLVGWDLPTDIGVYEDVHRGADDSSDFPRRVVPEVEVRQPFDEIELLKERHAGKREETLRGNELPAECLNIFSDTHFKNAEDVVDTSTDIVCAKELYARAAQSAALYNISSALNQRYYYPMRRWERLQPVSGASVSATDAWFTALSAEAGYYAGVGDKLSEDMPTNVMDARQPVSLLRVSRMGKSRWDSIEPYLTAADRSTIFVMIASYRDPLCGPTIEDLIRKAKNVHRVHVGITQQNVVGDLSCLLDIVFTPIPCFALPLSPGDEASDEEVARRRVFSDGDSPIGSSHRLCFFHDNIRIREMLSTQARGPTFARYLNMLLYRGESLLMVLDSHNRFKPHWDSLVTNLYYQYEDPKAVLSHYPLSLTDYGRKASDSDFNEPLSYLCGAFFLEYLGYPVLSAFLTYFPEDHYSNLRYNDPYVVVQSKDIRPSENFRFPQPWAAAGFMFGSALIMREVPFDPHLSNIFMGEEILFSVRLWTHGYNMYSPIYSIVYHYYFREDSPKVWDELPLWSTLSLMSRKRIHYLLRSRVEPSKHAASNSSEAPLIVPPSTREAVVLLDVDRYGMGKVRTVEQWYDYAGVDPVNYTVDGRWCGKHQDTK